MENLEKTAKGIRRDIVKMIGKAASGHPGGSLSAVEILSLLYFEKMNVDPKDPKKADRDRFVLSKGHAAPVLYATLAAKGFFDASELDNLRQVGAILQRHPRLQRGHAPGIKDLPCAQVDYLHCQNTSGPILFRRANFIHFLLSGNVLYCMQH